MNALTISSIRNGNANGTPKIVAAVNTGIVIAFAIIPFL